MQILQWLLKIPEQEPPRIASQTTKKECDHEVGDPEKKVMPKELVILVSKRRKDVPKSKVSCENLILLRFFYQTLNLKGVGAFKGCQNPLQKMTTTKKKTSENKVLPIGESWSRNDSSSNQVAGSDRTRTKKKKKAVSRMKELLKWAATAKVLNSKKEGVGSKQLGAVDDDVEESPKISFIIDMEDAAAAGIGNWITSDSEFVVLEL